MLPTVQSEPFKSFNRVSRNPYFYQELNFLCQPARDYIVTDIINYASSVAVGFLKLGWIAFIQIHFKMHKLLSRPLQFHSGCKIKT